MLPLVAALLVSLAATGTTPPPPPAPFVVVLGTAQDGGLPQAGCTRTCCRPAEGPPRRSLPASLALVDPRDGRRWLVDATPAFPEQLAALATLPPARSTGPALDGIFLTHAHVGHYAGLVHLGREVMGARWVPVWVMPRMAGFLANNGPWSQLVAKENLRMERLADGEAVALSEDLSVVPVEVPHRDEFSETVAFRIRGPQREVLWVPDIDAWGNWGDRTLPRLLRQVDRAYLDGTFFDGDELPGRDLSEIPHPLITQTLDLLASLPAELRAKVRFVHLNHTNPAHDPDSAAARTIRAAGADVAREGERFGL